jgi:hypothetical protein
MKTIRNLLVLMLMLLMASSAWAAGTVTVAETTGQIGKEVRQLVYTVTFGADAASPAAVALDNILTTAGDRVDSVAEWWLFKVSVLFGAVGPTDNSDLYLYRAYGSTKIDILGGNGANAIDNAANNTFYPATSAQPLIGSDLLVITNNAVNSAICYIVVEMYRQKR